MRHYEDTISTGEALQLIIKGKADLSFKRYGRIHRLVKAINHYIIKNQGYKGRGVILAETG
jgi:hypothetical protein